MLSYLTNGYVITFIALVLIGFLILLKDAISKARADRDAEQEDMITNSTDAETPGKCVLYSQGLFFEKKSETMQEYMVIGRTKAGEGHAVVRCSLEELCQNVSVLDHMIGQIYVNGTDEQRREIERIMVPFYEEVAANFGKQEESNKCDKDCKNSVDYLN